MLHFWIFLVGVITGINLIIIAAVLKVGGQCERKLIEGEDKAL
jgi:hypothetical protein